MSPKPSAWADLLLTFWVLLVAALYFGGYFFPGIGAWTGSASAFYAFMLLISAVILARRYLERTKK